jgi:hypothetical protein
VRYRLGDAWRPRLRDALARHSDGAVTGDPAAGCCWDADRLDLCRLGIRPDPRLLSTAAAREIALTIRPGASRPSPPAWATIWAEATG